MDKLLMRGCEIGADLHEAFTTTSRRQAFSKMTSARHASSEMGYWLRLLVASNIATQEMIRPFLDEAHELNKQLTDLCVKAHLELDKEKE